MRPERDWRDAAACAHVPTASTIFYHSAGRYNTAAKQICSACPSRIACLQHALDTDETHGIWGGATPGERLHLRHQHQHIRAS